LTLASKARDERGIERGVVTAERIAVMSGPGQDYTVEFWLHEGSEVRIEVERPDWLRVSMGGSLRGWIPAASLARI
jgi:SH3-like domain-containing protein